MQSLSILELKSTNLMSKANQQLIYTQVRAMPSLILLSGLRATLMNLHVMMLQIMADNWVYWNRNESEYYWVLLGNICMYPAFKITGHLFSCILRWRRTVRCMIFNFFKQKEMRKYLIPFTKITLDVQEEWRK